MNQFLRHIEMVAQIQKVPHHFFQQSPKPVKMKNVAKISPALTKWTDDYFISLREPKDHTVSVETMKKENRSQGVRQMSFIEFVKQYNTSGIYMVNPVPPFIGYETIYHNFILSYV
jgi:hypothetical protein